MPSVTYAELEVVTKAIASISAGTPTTDLHLITPAEKMSKNGLTAAVHQFLLLALGKEPEVAAFVQHFAVVDSEFPERLKTGLVKEYDRLRSSGHRGDRLFEELVWFSAGGRLTDLRQMAAGLGVLGYFFVTCEVFEK